MGDQPTIINSGLPPTQKTDDKSQKKGKKLPRLGMGSNPTDIFIRSLRSYPAAGEKLGNKEDDTPQQICSRPHQPSSLLTTSTRSSSSCSRGQNSNRSTLSSLN